MGCFAPFIHYPGRFPLQVEVGCKIGDGRAEVMAENTEKAGLDAVGFVELLVRDGELVVGPLAQSALADEGAGDEREAQQSGDEEGALVTALVVGELGYLEVFVF